MVKDILAKLLFFTATFFLALPANAGTLTGLSNGMEYFLYGAIAFVLFAITVTVYLQRIKKRFQKQMGLRTGHIHRSGFRNWWRKLDEKYFTKAASIEKEADVLLDHDYDGIKELNNALPPWWKWGFYITIGVAVIYIFRFHVIKSGPDPLQEYEREMVRAAQKLENFRKNSKGMFDEKTVTLADAKGIAEGKKIYTGTCFPCHGTNGEGNAVGPNLTDKYWVHGGSLGEVFHTITNGVPDKGMQAWGKTFSPTDIRNLSSFIMSLQGTNPANAKAPQGNLYEPAKQADSSAVKKDVSQVDKAKLK